MSNKVKLTESNMNGIRLFPMRVVKNRDLSLKDCMEQSKQPLIPERSTFYELPDGMNTSELKQYEKVIAKQYPNYSHRVRNRFFFRFNNTLDRNYFLNTLEETAKEGGLRVRRVLVFDY